MQYFGILEIHLRMAILIFFPNDNCLLLDKDGTTVSAAVLISKQALWDWISIVDKNKAYYDL
jgi:hypothetical protein